MAQIDYKSQYWATLTGVELAQAIIDKRKAYLRFVNDCGLVALWARMNRYFNGRDDKGFTTYKVHTDGDDAEIARLHVNHLRAIATRWLTMAKDARGGLQPIAEGDSHEAEEQQTYAKYLLDHYRFKHGIDSEEDQAIEFSGLFGTGWLFQWFNPKGGQPVLPGDLGDLGLPADPTGPPADADAGGMAALDGDAGAAPGVGGDALAPSGESPLAKLNAALMPPTEAPSAAPPVFSGELVVQALTPISVAHDPLVKHTKFLWNVVTINVNKWDLAIQYPDAADKIVKCSPTPDDVTLKLVGSTDGKICSEDEVQLHILMHKRSPSLPAGKLAGVIGGDCLLFEMELPTDEPTLRAVRPARIADSPFGYSPAWDALATTEAVNVLGSIALTNAKTFGVGSILSPKGSDLTPHVIAEGLNLIEYTPGIEAPKPMQFPTTPQEVFVSRKDYISEMGINLGVNDTVRGMPEASLKSGSALALVQTQGVEHSKDFQRDIRSFCERVALDTICIVQAFVSEEEQIPILGEGYMSLSSPISGKSIDKVKRVRITTISPLAMTMSGRVQMADAISERFPQHLRPGDYFRMINDGNLDHLTKLESQAEKNIDRENELLAQGYGPPEMIPDESKPPGPDGKPVMMPAPPMPGQKVVVVLTTDNPIAHVKKHLALLDNPSVRMGGPKADKIVKAVIAHIREHIAMYWKNSTTPDGLALLEIMGIPVLQAALPAAPPPMPGAPTEDGGEGGGPPSSAAKVVGQSNAGKLPDMPKMPKLPAAT